MMKREKHIVAAWAVLACLLPSVFTGCGKDVPDTDGKLSVPVLLSVGELSGGAGTKMTDKIVQNDDPRTFRGINNFYVVPFSIPKETTSNITREVIQASDPCFDENIQMTGNLKETSFDGTAANKGFFSPGSYVNAMTNTVLAYGQATAEISETVQLGTVAYKQRNGVIVPNDKVTKRTGARAGDIAFDLESILNNPADYNKWESANLAMLTAIANTQLDNGAKFKDNAALRPAFNAFTGTVTSGTETTSGAVFSVASEGAVLTRLYADCQTVIASAPADEETRKLAEKVCEVINSYSEGSSPLLAVSAGGVVTLQRSASTEFGLPDGAVALQWGEWRVGATEGSFGTPGKSEGVNLAAKEDYCFPPALWYFVNSPLLGSSAGGLERQFNDKTNYPKWSDIVGATQGGENLYTRGVSLDTKAAIVRDPLQYAVGLLSLKLNGPSPSSLTELTDKKGKNISIEDGNFPLTGIIVGGQRMQNFDFTASDQDMRFVYDADVYDESGAPKSRISSNWSSDPVYTLVFPTRNGEDIYFALEFSNESGETFTGAHDCTILPGSKFYLLGVMEYGTGTASGATKPAAVFVKDHITTLNVSFVGLASAYSILPELISPDLQMGVSTRLNWNVVPSSYELR